MKGLKKQIMPAIGIAAGAVGGGFVTKFIPVQNDKIKAAAPLVLGLLLSGKKGIIGDVGRGMIASGAITLAQSFGIGAIDYPVMDLDEVDTLDIEGVEADDTIHGADDESMPGDELN